ncbi:unnamed protein product, partial [Meganyctiphanes norvegica]
MKRATSQPRLIMWCKRCEVVALPECADHELCSVEHTLSNIQEEVERLNEEAKKRTSALLSGCEHNIAVYTWICGILRHTHSKMFVQLNAQQGIKRNIDKALEDITMNATIAGEKPPLEDNVEEVIEELQSLLLNMQKKVASLPTYPPEPPLRGSVQVMAEHQPPPGYFKTHIILETSANGVNMRVLGGQPPQMNS